MSTSIELSAMVASDADYLSLPGKHRNRIREWAAAVVNIERAKNEGKKLTGTSGIYALEASRLGVKPTALRERYAAWKASHDWRSFLDARARNGKANQNEGVTSERFRAFWVHLCERECRTTKAAYDKLMSMFQFGGALVPGFENHEPGMGKIPAGCSFRNLLRIAQEHKKDIERARRGAGSVRDLSVLSTRRGLKPGQYYQIDDVWHDHMIMWQGKAVRVLELGILDVASACRVHWGHLPRFEKDDGTLQGINRKMALMMMAYLLRYIGVHPEGCVLMMEHGTATLPESKISLLENCMGGTIRIRRGGIKSAEQKALGGYNGRGKGNPRAKAALESSHSRLHNDQGHLPMQTGWTGRNEPAITFGIKREAEQVAYWQECLLAKGRDDLAAALASPTMSFYEFTEFLVVKYGLINGRSDHSLEGWQDKKVIEYCLGEGLYIGRDELMVKQSPEQRQMLEMMIASNPSLARERNLSPREVWADREALVKIPFSIYVDLIGDDRDFGRQITVKDGLIKVKDQFVANGEELIYLAEVIMENMSRRHLNEGAKYRVVMNPFAPQELIVMEPDGAILGLAPQYTRVNPLTEEYYKTIGRIEGRKATMMAKQEARFESDNLSVVARQEMNRAIAEQGGVTKVRKSFTKASQAVGKVPAELPDTTWVNLESQNETAEDSPFDLGLDDATEIDFLGN